MGRSEAAALATQLMGSYTFPIEAGVNIQVFSTSLVELLMVYPYGVGVDVIKRLKQTYKALPPLATIKEELDKQRVHIESLERLRLSPPDNYVLTDDQEIINAMVARIRRRIKLPEVVSERGRKLTDMAIVQWINTYRRYTDDLSFYWLRNMGYIAADSRMPDPAPDIERSDRLSMEELKAKYGATWGISPEDPENFGLRRNEKRTLEEIAKENMENWPEVTPQLRKILSETNGGDSL
jgi:hypothetical protein